MNFTVPQGVTAHHALTQHSLAPQAVSQDEQTPLLTRATHRPAGPSHWDRDLPAHQVRRINVPHHLVRGLVPHALRPESVAPRRPLPAYVTPFRVDNDDARRGNAMVASAQFFIGSFGVFAACDGLFASGPTLFNPHGTRDVPLAMGSIAAGVLGFTIFGAAVGNLWYNALLTASAKHWREIQLHKTAATRTADTVQIASVCAVVIGAVALMADQLRRSQAAPPQGPAPYNAIYETWLALNLFVGGPHLVGGSNWYLGRLTGAWMAHALRPRPQTASDLEPHRPNEDLFASAEEDSYSTTSDEDDAAMTAASQITIRPRHRGDDMV